MKFDSSGGLLWNRTYGDLTSDEYLTSAIQLPDSSYIICGVKTKISGGTDEPSDIWVVKLSPVGEVLWESNLGSTDFDYNPSIVKSPEDGYFLSGLTEGHDGDVTGKHAPYDNS